MFFLKLTADKVLGFRMVCRLKLSFYSGEEGRSTCRGEISVQINPSRVVEVSSDIFLAQPLLENFLPIYCALNFYNLGYTY